MPVTLTNGEVLVARRAVDQLLQTVMPAQTALRIRRYARDLYATANEIEQEYQKIIDRYSLRGPEGEIQFEVVGGQRQPQIKDRKMLQQEHVALLDEATTDLEPMPIDTIKVAEEFRPAILLDMGDWLSGNTEIVGEPRSLAVSALVPTATGIHALAEHPTTYENATKLWRIYTQLRAASRIATKRRDALLAQHARRNAVGEMIYLDRVTSRVDVAEPFYAEEADLLATMIHVEGIAMAWLVAFEEKHKLPGHVAGALVDVIIDSPMEGESCENATG